MDMLEFYMFDLPKECLLYSEIYLDIQKGLNNIVPFASHCSYLDTSNNEITVAIDKNSNCLKKILTSKKIKKYIPLLYETSIVLFNTLDVEIENAYCLKTAVKFILPNKHSSLYDALNMLVKMGFIENSSFTNMVEIKEFLEETLRKQKLYGLWESSNEIIKLSSFLYVNNFSAQSILDHTVKNSPKFF